MKIQLLTDNEFEASIFGKYLDEFSLLKIGDEPSADVDLIILNINTSRNERSKRLGLSFLQKIRRDYFIKAPIIAYSFENLNADFPILKTKGISFLQLPFSSEALIDEVNKSRNKFLTESELIETVRDKFNLKEEWRIISHKIGGYLSNYSKHKKQIKGLVDEWTKSINRFASEECRDYLEEVRNLLDLPAEKVHIDKELASAIQTLDKCLQEIEKPKPPIDSKILPKCPPEGFSRILIADDEPLDSLISGLKNEYNYTVVGQAKGINEAKRQVEEKKPKAGRSGMKTGC